MEKLNRNLTAVENKHGVDIRRNWTRIDCRRNKTGVVIRSN